MVMKFPRSSRAMAMKKRSTKQMLPKRKLPKGYSVRGGYSPATQGVIRRVASTTMKSLNVADLAAGKAVSMASPTVKKAAEASFRAAGDALTAQAFSAAVAAAGVYARRRGRPRGSKNKTVKKPPEVHADSVAESSSALSMGIAPRNNALVPDKLLSISLRNGYYTAKEKKFFESWPVQTLLIYQSRIHNRLLHSVAPGHKSFWYPYSANIEAPTVQNIAAYRKGVEMSTSNTDTTVSALPAFLPTNADYGTVSGGQDFTYNLHLGGYADYCSVLSALTDLSFPARAERALQANAHLKFGTVSMDLSFELENNNKFYPAEFTIQVHEVIAPAILQGYDDHNPVAVLWESNGGIPQYLRGFDTDKATTVPESATSSSYRTTLSMLANGPTISNLTSYHTIFRLLQSEKVSLTAGSRLKVDVTQKVSPFDFFEYQNRVKAGSSANTNDMIRKGQIFITVMCKGSKEVIGQVYDDSGTFAYNANFISNPCQYTLMNIRKTAKVHAPEIIEKTSGTGGYDSINEEYVKFVNNTFSFGEQRQSQFSPIGQYDMQYSQVVDTPTSGSGYTVVFPVLTNQQSDTAGAR